MQYQCLICGWVYDEAVGYEEDALRLGLSGKMFRLIGRAQNVVL